MGGKCCLGVGDIVCGQWVLFVGRRHHLGAVGIVLGHRALFVGVGSCLWAGSVCHLLGS